MKFRLLHPPAVVCIVVTFLLLLFGVRSHLLQNGFLAPGSTNQAVISNTASVPQWSYLPASTLLHGSMNLAKAQFEIVKQDGSYGQANPPVNLYGVYLVAPGDFSLSATTQTTGTCNLALYDNPPLIADEFRIEPNSIRASVSNASSNVQVWKYQIDINPYTQKATTTQDFKINASGTHAISIERKKNTYITRIDGQVVSQLNQSILRSGSVWFGMWNSSGNCLITAFTSSAKMTDTRQMSTIPMSSSGLQTLAQKLRPDFRVGAAVALGPEVSDNAYRTVLFGNFGSITPENVMKWQNIEPQQGLFTYQEADALVAIAQKQGMMVHGHTLVFSEANPSWVTKLPTTTPANKQAVQTVMTSHITNVMTHYKGKVGSWDVINEPLADYDRFSDSQPLRQNIWLKSMGSAYIATALKTARQADPAAKLYINEYGLEDNGERWDAFLKLVTNLKNAGIPLDGVGFQAHVYSSDDKINPAILQQHMTVLSKLGLTSRISEMDVYDDDGTAVQAAQYQAVFMMCLHTASCVSFTTWGVDDTYDYFIDDDGTAQNGHDLLFNHGKPTPAYTLIQKSLQ